MYPAADGDAKRRAQTAFRDALGRMDQALNARDGDHLFASSVEAAMWATALELYLHKSDDSYRTRGDADTGGRVVRGLAWARNAVSHDLLNVHVIQGGFTFPLAFPAIETWGAWWLRRDQVVVTFLDSRPGNEKANDEHVAGRPVLTTLREAQDFLFMRAIPNMVTGPERAALARGSEDQRRHRPGCVALHPGVTWR